MGKFIVVADIRLTELKHEARMMIELYNVQTGRESSEFDKEGPSHDGSYE